MSYGDPFDPKKYQEETDAKLRTMFALCDLANEKKCDLSMDGMSVRPETKGLDPKRPDPGDEATQMLRFLGRMRKAAGAFFDNLPQD